MGDWEFLYEMHEQGYSPDEITEAAASGAAPWEWDHLEEQEIRAKQKHRNVQKNKIILNKCRIIFFDLEFYVPESSRTDHGFCYNPWDKKCKFLGGSFFSANPIRDFKQTNLKVKNKIKSLWLWNYPSEKHILKDIYTLLNNDLEVVRKSHDNMVSPILCGIGITNSDLPILVELFKRYKILTNYESFVFQNKFRVVDLSQLAISTFNNRNNFLYPKTKNVILNKYINGAKFESGKIVWDMYESKDYDRIEYRVIEEVISIYKCYKLINDDLQKFKALEKAEKRRMKDKIKNNGTI